MTRTLSVTRALSLHQRLGSEVAHLTGKEAEAAGHPDKLYVVDGVAYDLGEVRELVTSRVDTLMHDLKIEGTFRTIKPAFISGKPQLIVHHGGEYVSHEFELS